MRRTLYRIGIALVLGTLVLVIGGRMIWIYSDQYQIQEIIAQAPLLVEKSQCETVAEWSQVLALSGELESSLNIGRSVKDPNCKQLVFTGLVETFATIRDKQTANGRGRVNELLGLVADESLASTLALKDVNLRYEKLKELAVICKRVQVSKTAEKAAENTLSALKENNSNIDKRYEMLVKLAADFAKAGLEDTILSESRKIENLPQRCYLLTHMATILAENYRRDEALHIANEAKDLLPLITEERARSEAYARVAMTYADTGIDVETALNLIPGIQDDTMKNYVRYLAIWEFNAANKFEQAISITNEITTPYYRALSYTVLIPNIYKNEKSENFDKRVEAVKDSLIHVAEQLAIDLAGQYIGKGTGESLDKTLRGNKKQDAPDFQKTWEQTKETPYTRSFFELVCFYANKEADSLRQYKLYRQLWNKVSSFPEYEQEAASRALSAAKNIQAFQQRDTALLEVCQELAKQGKVKESLEIGFNEIADTYALDQITRELTAKKPTETTHKLEELFGGVAKRFGDSARAVTAYIALARALSSAGVREKGESASGFAFGLAQRLNRPDLSAQVAELMLENKKYDKALMAARQSQDTSLITKVETEREPSNDQGKKLINKVDAPPELMEEVTNLAQNEQYRKARLLAEKIVAPDHRLQLYTEILRPYAKKNNPA